MTEACTSGAFHPFTHQKLRGTMFAHPIWQRSPRWQLVVHRGCAFVLHGDHEDGTGCSFVRPIFISTRRWQSAPTHPCNIKNERALSFFFVRGGANSFAACGGQLVSDERIIILINSTDTKAAAAAAVGQCCNVGRGRKEGGRPSILSLLPVLSPALLPPSFPFHGRAASPRPSVLRLLPASLFVGECRCRIVSVPEESWRRLSTGLKNA